MICRLQPVSGVDGENRYLSKVIIHVHYRYNVHIGKDINNIAVVMQTEGFPNRLVRIWKKFNLLEETINGIIKVFSVIH